MALAIDASSPAVSTQTTTSIATVASNSFTPPAGSIVVVAWICDGNNPAAPSITDSLGTHLTWNLIQWKSQATSPTAPGQAAMWWASVTTSTAMTVTVTSGSISGERAAAIKPWVLTGADTTQVGTTGKNARNGSAGTTIAETYTAAQTGGWGFIVDCDFAGAGSQTPGAGMTSDGTGTVLTNVSYGFMRRTSADDTAAVGTTLNVTTPSTTTISWVWAEPVPAPSSGPVAVDAAMPTYQSTPGLGPWGPDQFVQDTFTSIPDVTAPPPYQAAWWRSDTLTVANGAGVASWADSSGNGQTLTQATGGSQPQYVTNVINGRPVVRFDGLADFLDATITSRTPPNTWFVVFKTAAVSTTMNITSGGEEILVDTGGLVEIWGGASSISNITASVGTVMLLGVQINGVSSAIWSDNAAGTIGNLGTDPTGTALRVGNHTALSRFFNGDIAEIIMYNRVLTADERGQVFGYLHTKYLTGATPSANPTAEETISAATAFDAVADVDVNAEDTAAAATAFDATVSTTSGASAPAETTTASAVALDAVADIGVNAEQTTAAATGLDAAASAGVPAGTATATTVGFDATASAGVPAEQTTAAAAALDAAAAAGVPAETTTAAATAFDATVSTATAASAPAEQTTAAATGYDAAASAGPNAGNAAAAAVALDAAPAVGVPAETTTAAATAFDATVSTAATASAPAENAAASASGFDAAVAATVNAETTTAAAAGLDATASAGAAAETTAAAASGFDAAAAVTAGAEQTSAAAAAFDATVSTSVSGTANAENGAATATGFDAVAAVGGLAQPATAATTGFDAAVSAGPNAETTTAAATAFDAAAAVTVPAETTTAAATAFDATVSTATLVNAPAEQTAVAASALAASVAVTVPAEQAAAAATGFDAAPSAGVPAGAATAAATAFDATVSYGRAASAEQAAAAAAAYDAAAAAAAGAGLAGVAASAFDATVLAVSEVVPFGLLEAGATAVSGVAGGSAVTASATADAGPAAMAGVVS